TCARCKTFCPVGIDTSSLLLGMRQYFLNELNMVPDVLNNLWKSLEENRNIFGLDNSARNYWTLYTGANVKEQSNVDTVFFAGCVSCYQGRAQDTALAISEILNHMGEDWGILNDEWCCGHPLVLSGMSPKEYAQHNIELIESMGARRVVTGCPGCNLALRNEWPEAIGKKLDFQVMHFSEYLYLQLKQGKLKIPKVDVKLTYHDPCELGRQMGIIVEPRQVLKSITSKMIEPDCYGEKGFCCGAGGLLGITNPMLSDNLALKRFELLSNKGQELVISSCPSCVQALGKASKKTLGVNVADLAQLVAEQLGLQSSTVGTVVPKLVQH
ncbi:MAG: (Fe-S)-binding protein, partial [Nitrososphaeraceae archaeon]|nr:(Fe-S)-binding protein [Nitrososphaeraceae archaeon]